MNMYIKFLSVNLMEMETISAIWRSQSGHNERAVLSGLFINDYPPALSTMKYYIYSSFIFPRRAAYAYQILDYLFYIISLFLFLFLVLVLVLFLVLFLVFWLFWQKEASSPLDSVPSDE